MESFTSVANGVVYIGSNDYYIYAIGAIAAQQPASPLPTTSPSPTVPEFPQTILLLVVAAMFLIVAAGLVAYRRHNSHNLAFLR